MSENKVFHALDMSGIFYKFKFVSYILSPGDGLITPGSNTSVQPRTEISILLSERPGKDPLEVFY